MNIIVLTLDYPPHRFIGAEIAMHRLVLRLKAQGHKVQVRILAEKAARFEGIRATPHKTTALWNPDLVITNAGLATRSRLLWPDAPVVVWAHNNSISVLLDVKESGPSLLISNTHHMREVFHSVIGTDSMVLHPLADPTIERRESSYPDSPRAFTLINGSAEKGGEIVAEVAAMLTETKFIVVEGGHGPQVPQPSPNVDVRPASRDLTSVWRDTGTLLIPSRSESYSMAGFEALQRGIPVIASDLPGVREALGEQEVYIPSLTARPWSNSVLTSITYAILNGSDGLRRQRDRALHVQGRLETIDHQFHELLGRIEGL